MTTRTRAIAALALLPLALSACGGDDDATDTSSPSSSVPSSASASPTTLTNTGHWTGEAGGVKIDASTTADAPADVQDAWRTLGHEVRDVMAVDVDNRQGAGTATVSDALFTTPEGESIEYSQLWSTLEASDAPTPLDTDVSNGIIDVHNRYTGDEYEIPAGASQTILLVPDKDLPKTLTHATLSTSEDTITLTPADGTGPTAPAEDASAAATTAEPTAETTVEPTAAATAEATEAEAPAGATAPTVQDYLAAGGGCTADVWNVDSIPYSPELAEQVYAYCDANNLGDWAGDLDPRNPANFGSPEDHTPAAEEPTISREECSAMDPETATSGEIQSCNLAYGYGNY